MRETDDRAPALPRRKRVLILGGGMASLTAAWELTRRPGWERELEVTVLQMGWRVGGKTATGRGVHERIEEHGIHILQGWYENTFRLLGSLFEERAARGLAPAGVSTRWQDAFVREHATLLTEWVPSLGRWTSWQLVLPWNDQVPGEGGAPTTWELVRKALALALELCVGSPVDPATGPMAALALAAFFPPDQAGSSGAAADASTGDDGWRSALDPIGRRVRREAARAVTAMADGPRALRTVGAAVERVAGWFERRTRAARLATPRARHAWSLIEAAVVGLRGLLVDLYDPADDRFHWRRIDDLDFRAWLKRHGASDDLLASPMVRFVYTGTFSSMPTPDAPVGLVAAGTAMRFVVKSLGFKGAFVWKFKAGTGDTLVAPLFEVLRARGVRFEFFRRVEELHPGPDGADREISAVTVLDQADVPSGTYDPLVPLGPMRVWPSEPRWEQLDPAHAEALRAADVDLECPWTDWPGARRRVLRRGEDFDELVLGIPVAALRSLSTGLAERDARWRAMLDHVATVGTHAVQLWLRPTLAELGMNVTEWGMAPGSEPNLVTYADPLYSWLEMTLVAEHERWPAALRPGTILYFTGWMRDEEPLPSGPSPDHAQRVKNRGLAITADWLRRHSGWLFPRATTAAEPAGLDLSLLVDPTASGLTGMDLLRAQFHRTNVDPSSRYTRSLPGTARYRLRVDGSGWRGLWLCGDWVDYGMNVGYVEGAVTSGAQAARALWRSLDLPPVDDVFVDLDVE